MLSVAGCSFKSGTDGPPLPALLSVWEEEGDQPEREGGNGRSSEEANEKRA